jgi:hypothetical protein
MHRRLVVMVMLEAPAPGIGLSSGQKAGAGPRRDQAEQAPASRLGGCVTKGVVPARFPARVCLAQGAEAQGCPKLATRTSERAERAL